MTLRLRLVAALVVLVTVGLAVFGVTTYVLYARSEYQRLDDQLRSSVPAVAHQLQETANLVPASSTNDTQSGSGDQPPVVAPPDAYGELLNSKGTVVARAALVTSSAQPELPATLPAPGTGGRFIDAGSVTGSTRWRVFISTTQQPSGGTLVIAFPVNEVRSSLRHLVLIESIAAAALLVLLALGSWLVLRRGLRPLETMATSASSITAGDLSRRVSPSEPRTEIGQLGLALNTMLEQIETAFREREATEHRLRQFLADASHELRTPLTSIQGFAELFRLGASDDPDKLALTMRRIEEESDRMKTLVEELLLLARLDETRPAERLPVDLSVLAADACTDAAAVAPERRFTLDAPHPVVVLGDEAHLRQAIGNLVANAIRHTPAATAVDVSAVGDDGTAAVTVRDHGAGIDEASIPHVFDRFWQADPARAGRGAGLGLAIVAAVAEEHGGEAGVANAPGGGAAFTLRLPLPAG